MTTFNEVMLARDRTLAIRIGKYQSSDIKEASFNYGYIAGDTFKPGGVCAGSGKVVFTSIITSFAKLDKVYPEIGLLVDDQYEWVKMGEYFINEINIDRNANQTTVELMDGMFKLNQPFISNLTYPVQIRDFIREICAKTNIQLQTDNLGMRAIQQHIQTKPTKKDITFREVLSQTIQLLGFSAFFNREGKLEIRGLTESNLVITADNYFLHGLTRDETLYQIAGITCKKDNKKSLTVGLRTGRSLELENEFMSQNILDDLYYDLKNLTYYPFNLNYQGHLKLQVGQWVTIKTNKNEVFKVPVLSQSFTFKGGLTSRISADSKAGNDSQYFYSSYFTRRIEQAATGVEAEVQQQLEHTDSVFNKKVDKFKQEFGETNSRLKKELTDQVNSKLADAEKTISNKVIGDFQTNLEQVKKELTADFNSTKTTLGNDIRNFDSKLTATKNELTQSITALGNSAATKILVEETAKGIREEISQISVGGRNLILKTNTDQLSINWNMAKGSAKKTFELFENGKYKAKFVRDNVANTSYSYIAVSSMNLKALQPNTDYIISFKLLSNRTGTVGQINLINGNWTKGLVDVVERKQVNYTAGKEAEIIVRWRTKAVLELDNQVVYLQPGDLSTEAEFTIWDLQVEKGTVATDWTPAPEDTDSLITAAKASFEKTAEGLATRLTAVESYKNADGQRTEALHTYVRDETAKVTTAIRTSLEQGYATKQSVTDTANEFTRKFESLKVGGSNLLIGTKDLSGNTFKPHNTTKTYQGFTIAESNYSGTSYTDTYGFIMRRPATETDYILSFYAKSSKASQNINCHFWNPNTTGTAVSSTGQTNIRAKGQGGDGQITVTVTNEWKRYWVKWENISTDKPKSIILGRVFGGDVQIAAPALYSGTMKTEWEEAPEDVETKFTEFKQSVDGAVSRVGSVEQSLSGVSTKISNIEQTNTKIQASVSKLDAEGLKKSDVSITENGITLGAGKTVNGKNLASMLVAQPESINAITKLFKVTGNMIVNGAITGKNLAAETVTGDKIKFDQAYFDKMLVNNALVDKLTSNQGFISKLQTIDLSASHIKGGLLTSTNNATTFNLQTGDIQFLSKEPVIYRKNEGHPEGRLKIWDFTSESHKGTGIGLFIDGSSERGGGASIQAINAMNDLGFVNIMSNHIIDMRAKKTISLEAEDIYIAGNGGTWTLKKFRENYNALVKELIEDSSKRNDYII